MGDEEREYLIYKEPRNDESHHQPVEDYFWDIVGKNNQNTLLLDRLFEAKIPDDYGNVETRRVVAIQSETRVFLFHIGSDGSDGGDIQGSTGSQSERKEEIDMLDKRRNQCRELLLKLYVAPMVRLIKIASSFFSILDNLTFACIVLLFFFGGLLDSDMKHKIHSIIEGRLYGSTALVVLLCSDILHNIMHASTRLWNLNRVDFPLVMVFYAAYFVIMVVDNIPKDDASKWDFSKSWIYFYALGFRFAAFYISESCEYWMDVLVVKILVNQQKV